MNTKSSIVAILREFLSRYPKQFALLFALLVVEGVVVAASVLAVVPMADFLFDPTFERASRVTKTVGYVFGVFGFPLTFWTLGTIFVVSNLIKGLFGVAIQYAILRIKYSVIRGLIDGALRTFFSARWEFFSGSDHGSLLNTLNKELSNIGDTLGHLATQMAQTVQVCIYLAVPFWLNARMTITALALAVLFGLPFLLLHRVGYRLGRRNTETANVAMGVLSELLQAARLILGFGRQSHACQRYLAAFDQHTYITLRSQILQTAVPKLFQPLALLAAVVAMGLALKKQTGLAEVAGIMWSLLACLPTLAAILQSNMSVSNFLPSFEQLIMLRERAAMFKEVEGSRIFQNLEQGIEFKGVTFSYPGRTQTLSGLNLHFRKGQTTALVGESGSGKSTVIDIVLGLQLPNQGQVLVDGVALRDWNLKSLRERIGYVPQEPLLFHASIRENLLWACESADESDLWEALRLANAAQFVRELPEGIATFVGDRGVRLSGGQRQRIALARALLRKPELLILDEATSSLDSESERLIQEAIGRVAAETTILVVAHRLSTVAGADQVYVLRSGKVVEEGRFENLIRKPGGVLAGMVAVGQALESAVVDPS